MHDDGSFGLTREVYPVFLLRSYGTSGIRTERTCTVVQSTYRPVGLRLEDDFAVLFHTRTRRHITVFVKRSSALLSTWLRIGEVLLVTEVQHLLCSACSFAISDFPLMAADVPFRLCLLQRCYSYKGISFDAICVYVVDKPFLSLRQSERSRQALGRHCGGAEPGSL